MWDMEDPSSNPPRSGFPNYTLFAVQSFVYNSNPSENQTTSFTNTDPKNNACMKSDNHNPKPQNMSAISFWQPVLNLCTELLVAAVMFFS